MGTVPALVGADVTPKQRRFAELMVEGHTGVAAYRRAYEVGTMSAKHIANEAWKLSRHPEVARIVKAGLAARERQVSYDAARIRELVVERLIDESLTARQDGARVRALELLGKLNGVDLFRERPVKEDPLATLSVEELEQRLRERLTQLLADGCPPWN